jgi:tripartite ATP-independent transporter DctM subunit
MAGSNPYNSSISASLSEVSGKDFSGVLMDIRHSMIARLFAVGVVALVTSGSQVQCSSGDPDALPPIDEIDGETGDGPSFTTRLVIRDSAGRETDEFRRGELITFEVTVHNKTTQPIVLSYTGMSGSALADAAGSGKLMQVLMTKDGRYTPSFAAALTAASSVIGPIIPPSIPLVIYALVSDTSIGFLFLAGVIPGILIGVVQMALIAYTARRRNFPVEKSVPLRDLPRVTWEAFPALMLPVILLGLMYSGVTTPTEAAAAAAAYALLVSAVLYRSIGWHDLYNSLLTSARMTISIGMLIAGAIVFNYVVTAENIPKTISVLLKAYELSPLGFLLWTNVLLLILGCFLEGTTILLIIVPVLLPTAQALGIDPVHFGVVAVVNIMIGLITPPYGLLLFMMVKIADVPLKDIVRDIVPFLAVMIGALAMITLIPDLVLFLPRLLGYKG